MFRFGELNVARVRRIIAGDTSVERAPKPGKPPELCPGCPHRTVFTALRNLNCIVSGDIGCYSLGVLPPFEAMDTLVCMGASIGPVPLALDGEKKTLNRGSAANGSGIRNAPRTSIFLTAYLPGRHNQYSSLEL